MRKVRWSSTLPRGQSEKFALCSSWTAACGAARTFLHPQDIHHSTAQGAVVRKACIAARGCGHSARHPPQRGTWCHACGKFPVQRGDACTWQVIHHSAAEGAAVLCGAARICLRLQDVQHSSAQCAVVLRKTCLQARDACTCKISNVHHNAAQDAAAVRRTCGAARKCLHLANHL